MSHPDVFNLSFVKFEESPPPGIATDTYQSPYGWHWHQSDTDAEGFCQYWKTEEERDKEIQKAGGVLAFVLEESTFGDLCNSMEGQLRFQEGTVTLNINGSQFIIGLDADGELTEVEA